jgi:Fe-S oxidoreductase
MSESSIAAAPAFDKQGDATDGERVGRARNAFVKDFGLLAAAYLETCVHCGICADACHYYEVTKDPKYTPILKVEPFKQAYKREYGPFALFYKIFNLKPKVTMGELEHWQELLYDSCTECGRCSLVCPMGIDVAGLIIEARHGMAAAGLVPRELWHHGGDSAEQKPAHFKEQLLALGREHAVAIAVDKPKAEIVCTIFPDDLARYPKSVLATARIMNYLGLSWTFRSADAQASTLGLFSGKVEWQKETALGLIEGAIAAGAKALILPECGHAYGALRWEGANFYGKPLPFRVLHISEFLAEQVQLGALKLNPVGKTATFHDPCQVSRRGGAIEAPRIVLAALGLDLKEMYPTKGTNWCCGGGGGVNAIKRADPLRYKVFRLKMEQVMETGAELPVTSCSGCRKTFDDGQAHYHWDKTMSSLVELVADNLAEASS